MKLVQLISLFFYFIHMMYACQWSWIIHFPDGKTFWRKYCGGRPGQQTPPILPCAVPLGINWIRHGLQECSRGQISLNSAKTTVLKRKSTLHKSWVAFHWKFSDRSSREYNVANSNPEASSNLYLISKSLAASWIVLLEVYHLLLFLIVTLVRDAFPYFVSL